MTARNGLPRAAFAVLDPETAIDNVGSGLRAAISTIPFRFNPEKIERKMSFEQAAPPQNIAGGTGGPGAGGVGAAEEHAADAPLGRLKETFSLLLRFDLADREEGLPYGSPKAQFGVLPEISALEDLLYPIEDPGEAASIGREVRKARPRRPQVLLIWGERRILPVRITGMTVAETLFNARLYPTRAEVTVELQTLLEGDTPRNGPVAAATKFTTGVRRKMRDVHRASVGDTARGVTLLE